MAHTILKDVFLALLVTVVGAALAWGLVGSIPMIGIDDAAITRSYSENLAQGAGYVYNVGGERVEGATSLLWTLILAGAYLITPAPEILIIVLCGLITFGAVLATFRLTRHLTDCLGGTGGFAVAIVSVVVLASPGYFLWSVWTMMELALWSAVLLCLILCLVKAVENVASVSGRGSVVLFLPAMMLPLIRPEGVVIAFGLVALATLLTPNFRKRGLIALGLIALVFVAVTSFRLVHFGQPFPNTFYAKVSSDRVQDLVDGVKYMASFLLDAPFVAVFVAAWAATVVWALTRITRPIPGSRGFLVAGAAVFGMIAVYAALGGDHFALWRFYQPITPLLPVPVAIGIALIISPSEAARSRTYAAYALPVTAGIFAIFSIGWVHYYQARFDVKKEFVLVEQGLGFGHYLNQVDPLPSIGVGPAGGIALAYDGYIYDLLGLNWTEMAHANPVKVGMRNHASFDKATFWKHRPDVLAVFNRRCTEGETQAFWATNDDAFDGLFEDDRFRDEFVPVLFRDGTECWPGFAVPEWLAEVADSAGVETLAWSDIQILN